MSVCISFTYLGVKWVMFALAQELNTSEQSPRNILPIKSIARATSCFVANAKTHNAFPQNSFLARAVYHKELFVRARYQGFQLTRAAKNKRGERA